MNDMIDTVTRTLTVSLSIPALVLCCMVLVRWFPEAFRSVRERRDAADWLVLGVAISFLGIVINIGSWSSYWLMWLLDVDPEVYRSWGRNSAIVNLMTRQVAVIAAAYCHLKAYSLFSPGRDRDPSIYLWGTLGASALAALGLLSLTDNGVPMW